jgi:hypothetical protein
VINRLPRAKRAAEVTKWKWSSQGGPDGGDEQEFVDTDGREHFYDLHAWDEFWS